MLQCGPGNADQQNFEDPGCFDDRRKGALGAVLITSFNFDQGRDVIVLLLRAFRRADLFEDMQRFIMTIFADQPARAFRRAPHANEQADGRNRLYQQHIAPDVRQMAPDDANDRVDGKRRQLANDDGDFIQAGQLAAHLGRRHF